MVWTIGYLSIWGSKWIIGQILGYGTIMDALTRVLQRINGEKVYEDSDGSKSINIFETILVNINVIKIPVIIFGIVIIILFIICKIKKKKIYNTMINYIVM